MLKRNRRGILPSCRLSASSAARVLGLAVWLLLPDSPLASSSAADVAAAIRAETRAIAAGEPGADRDDIVAVGFIEAFYAARDDRPAWYRTTAGEQLRDIIAASGRHGFEPEEFHGQRLSTLMEAAEGGDPAAIAEFEIVASDAAARYIHHLYRGKVDPERLDPDWNIDRPGISADAAVRLSEIIDADGFQLVADRLAPSHPQYLAIQAALQRYRAIEAQGGWPELASGDPIKSGMRDGRVETLRARLIATGDLDASAASGDRYDAALVAAVKRFQTRHGLEPDGVIGPASLRALNAPVEARIDQLRASLERARWILRGLGNEFVLVNIAGARTYLFRDGEVIWRTRSIVGQQYRKTPVFRDAIRYIEVNPTWTVPVSISQRDKLPRIREDLGYLAQGGYRVVDMQGNTLNPAAVDWSASNPGVTLVQQPGPGNALGLIKFMFPNEYAVYLHDTDNHSLFDRAARALSSGCVRIEHPFELADLILQGSPDWSPERRDAILASGQTTRINLPEPLPVLLTYYTAWVADDAVMFRGDIYERDQPLLDALDRPFEG